MSTPLGTRAPAVPPTEPDRASSLIITSDFDQPSEIESLSLKDTRPLPEQKSDWNKLREMIASWKPRAIELDEAA